MSFYLKKYMWLISLVAVVICSYFLARMTANFIALQFEGSPTPPSVKLSEASGGEKAVALTEEDITPIAERNVFDSQAVPPSAQPDEKGAEPEVDVNADVDPNGEAVATSLGIKLISTFSVGAGTDERSTCIISEGKGQGSQDVYTVGGEKSFAPEAKITKILHDRVEFIRSGRLEFVALDDFTKGSASITQPPVRDTESATPAAKKDAEPAIEKSADGKFVIDRAEIDNAIANLDKLYTDIRAVPHFKDGRPDGLKLLSVKAGSIFSKLGLQRGDVLQKINGMDLDIKKGLEIFNQLKTESHIAMDVERRGSNQVLNYEIR